MRRLMIATGMIATGLLLALTGAVAADIRIDREDRPRPAPTPPPGPPQAEDKGCASKSSMAPEWVFAAGALALGAWGLRRQRPSTRAALRDGACSGSSG